MHIFILILINVPCTNENTGFYTLVDLPDQDGLNVIRVLLALRKISTSPQLTVQSVPEWWAWAIQNGYENIFCLGFQYNHCEIITFCSIKTLRTSADWWESFLNNKKSQRSNSHMSGGFRGWTPPAAQIMAPSCQFPAAQTDKHVAPTSWKLDISQKQDAGLLLGSVWVLLSWTVLQENLPILISELRH